MVVDRISSIRVPTGNREDERADIPIEKFIPSIEEQRTLIEELVYLFTTSVIQNIPQMKTEFANIYPTHLNHQYSAQAGEKTKQVLFHLN